MQVLNLEDRTTPSGVWSQDGLVYSTDRSTYRPFDDYSGPIQTAHIADSYIVAAAVNRVQLRDADNRVVLDEIAFEEGWQGGVNVALTSSTLYVGAAAGGGPRLKEYDIGTGKWTVDRFVFEPSFRGGVDVDGYGNHVVVLPGVGGGPVAEVDGQLLPLQTDPNLRNIVASTLADADYDNIPEIVIVVGQNIASFDLQGNQIAAAHTTMQYTQIAGGDLWFKTRNSLIGSFNGGGIDQLDIATGFINWYYEDQNTPVVGTSYEPNPRPGSSIFVPIMEWPNRTATIPQPGTSVGGTVGTGTFTAVVVDHTDGTRYGLTNRHVTEDIVYAPGPADANPPVRLGEVVRKAEFGVADSVLFTLERPVSSAVLFAAYNHHTDDFDTLEVSISGTTDFKPNQLVYKAGRTSGTIRGIVTETNAVSSVQYRNGITYDYTNQNIIYGFNMPFSAPGDSGSPILTYDRGQWLLGAQLFAGGGFVTIATDIDTVFNELQVTL